MRLEVRAIKNRLCGARNKNIKNIGKNNGLLNETEKGECGPKSMGQNGVESHLGTVRVPMDLHTNKCLITQGRDKTSNSKKVIGNQQFRNSFVNKIRMRQS